MQKKAVELYCLFLRALVRVIAGLAGGKGGGRLATLLPKGQRYLIQKYFKDLTFNIDTTYPIEGTIWLSGVYDIRTTQFLQSVIRPGDVLLDIGANCGALTLVAASLVGHGKVYAFEPGPAVCDRLQANVKANPQLQDVVQVMPIGLGANEGQLCYAEDPNYRGNALLLETEGVPVSVMPLDAWVEAEKLTAIDLIKIDVEGMEYEVLQGSKAVLTRFQPMLYFETLPIFYQGKSFSIRSLYEFLSEFGYRIVQPEPPYAVVPLDGPYPANSVAVHPRQFDRLGLTTSQ